MQARRLRVQARLSEHIFGALVTVADSFQTHRHIGSFSRHFGFASTTRSRTASGKSLLGRGSPRRSFWVPARPYPRIGHAVGDAEIVMAARASPAGAGSLLGPGALYRLYIGSISASPTACPLRGYGRAGTRNDHLGEAVILSTGTPIPAQRTCRRRCRDRADIELPGGTPI